MDPEPGLYFDLINSFSPVFLDAGNSIELFIGFLSVILLLFSSALISSSEVAYFSINANDLFLLKEENSSNSKTIVYLKSIPRRLLATILISNNFINIAIVIVSDFILRILIPLEMCEYWANEVITRFSFTFIETTSFARFIHFFITVVGVTFLLVLFGEVVPKVYAKINNLKIARFMAKPLLILSKLFSPFSSILVNWTNIIESGIQKRNLGMSPSPKKDIDEAIELTVSNDQGAKQEIDILKGIVKFGEVTAKQIMRSRVDVVAVDFKTNFKDLLNVVKESGYSRIPVYDLDFDNITGILYAKDLIRYLDENEQFEWQELIRTEVLYVPESKKISDLLNDFQEKRMHMAIVVDEYGGSAGIVTLEDIMEEVIGEIKDEFDAEQELEFQKIDEYNYIFEGKTLLNDVCRILGVDTDSFDEIKGDADSLAGLLLEVLGYIPQKGTELEYKDFKFKIISVSRRRIEKIKVNMTKRLHRVKV